MPMKSMIPPVIAPMIAAMMSMISPMYMICLFCGWRVSVSFSMLSILQTWFRGVKAVNQGFEKLLSGF